MKLFFIILAVAVLGTAVLIFLKKKKVKIFKKGKSITIKQDDGPDNNDYTRDQDN